MAIEHHIIGSVILEQLENWFGQIKKQQIIGLVRLEQLVRLDLKTAEYWFGQIKNRILLVWLDQKQQIIGSVRLEQLENWFGQI